MWFNYKSDDMSISPEVFSKCKYLKKFRKVPSFLSKMRFNIGYSFHTTTKFKHGAQLSKSVI